MEIGYAKILEVVTEKIPVKIDTEFIPSEFKSKDGLYVDSDFTSRILNKAASVAAGSEYSIISTKLLVGASDTTIESALPEKHIFSESDVSAIVADLVAKQPDGIEGTLLNNGYANIFYTPEFVVRVRWRSDSRRWLVYAWYRHGLGWGDDYRVFAPAN